MAHNPEYYKAYYARNREKIRAIQKANYDKNPHHGINNLDYRRMVLGLLLQRDGRSCGVCGEYMEDCEFSIDHIKQRAIGGGDEGENLRLTHKVCNASRPKPSIKRGTYDDTVDF